MQRILLLVLLAAAVEGCTQKTPKPKPSVPCGRCPMSIPTIEGTDVGATPFSADQITGLTPAGCLIRHLNCTSVTPGYQVVISYNKDQNGVDEGIDQIQTRLTCNAQGKWKHTGNGVTAVINTIGCFTA